jgi:hypothetical protein
MSTEYDKQQAEIARHRREVEQAAQATALAAQRTAQSAERARLEQYASLQRQEEIAETNSFRTTILSTIPLLNDSEKQNYIIKQISKRLPQFDDGSLSIINKNQLYDTIGLHEYLKTIINEISKTNEWSDFIETCSKQDILVAKAQKSKANWTKHDILNNNLKVASILLKTVCGCMALILWLLIIFGDSGPIEKIVFTAISLGFYWIMSWITINIFYPPHIKSIQILQVEINQKSTSVKNNFMAKIKYDDYKSIILRQSIQSFAEVYFDRYVYQDIQKEQEFLPPSYQLNPDDWKSSTITNSTLLNISEKIKQIEEEINNDFSFEWFTNGKISFKQ